MKHILSFFYQWTPTGECYELMVVHWFDTMIQLLMLLIWLIPI